MQNQETYARAEKRVEEKMGFYIHISIYILVNIGLIALNLITAPEALWFQWPLVGWGIGVAIHAMMVFVFGAGSAIREKMIEAELKKESLEE